MSPIITHTNPEAHPDRDTAARRRADRLAKATPEQMQSALAFLSMIDDEAFEIAFTAVAHTTDDPDDEEPIPLCATCGAPIGIFPDITLNWRHYRGSSAASGAQETYNPGHSTEPAWYLENEAAEQF